MAELRSKEALEHQPVHQPSQKPQAHKETKKEETKMENPATKVENKETKPEHKPVQKVKKSEAFAYGRNLSLSKKHCMYICDFIKNKSIDQSILELEQVLKFKRAIPFKGEIPHRHDLGMMSGRYPITAAKAFITILKGLKGNAIVNGLDLSKTRIFWASASWASRPAKRGGMRFKRAHVVLKVKEMEAKK